LELYGLCRDCSAGVGRQPGTVSVMGSR
jgi:hypothetical protein